MQVSVWVRELTNVFNTYAMRSRNLRGRFTYVGAHVIRNAGYCARVFIMYVMMTSCFQTSFP